MSQLPRMALGTIQPEAETRFAAWAVMDLLASHEVQIQHFNFRCSYQPIDGAITATGLESRQLDSWLMTADQCRAAVARGCGDSELLIVEGRYEAALAGEPLGGRLDPLCDWLGLQRVVILDVKTLDPHQLPTRPQADAILLDRISGPGDLSKWKTQLESLWQIPVLGGLEELPALRDEIRSLPPGSLLPREFCEELGSAFGLYTRAEALVKQAERSLELLSSPAPSTDGQSPASRPSQAPVLTIALAYDEAFHCYFSDVLEHLESLGAQVIDFSPLHDESLPPATDLVYIGCGFPEQHAEALAENHCMVSALREHVCAGKRIFADGGGLAYLCQYLETPDGRWQPMTGILPARAHLSSLFLPPTPVEGTLAADSWLAPQGTRLRGYLPGRWSLEPTGELSSLLAESGHALDLVGCYQAIGSRIQFNFSVVPQLLERILATT